MVLVDEAPVTAHLDGVVTLAPAEVVNDVVNRDVGSGTAGFCGGVGQEAEVDVVAFTLPTADESLANIAVADVVDHAGVDAPGFADREAFTVVFENARSGLAGELLGGVDEVVLEVSAGEDAVPVGENVIDAA